LFSGAGGIAEGFRQAGFKCFYANDFNEWAVTTFKANHPKTEAECRPIEEVDAAKLRKKLGLAKRELTALCGGPPCQGFSINAPERFLEDPRNSLFKHYVRFLKEFMPKTFLFENVPGMLSLDGGKIFSQILREFDKLGYATAKMVLFAPHYGVPQERWRLIVLGSLGKKAPQHPWPTHYAVGRANFTGSRENTIRLTELERLSLLPPVTIGQALSDLPKLSMGEGAEEIEYDRPALSDYAKEMRDEQSKTFNHFAGELSAQNAERLKYIKPGGSWRDIPHELLPAGMQRARRSDHTKRYGRLKLDGFASTIMTKCDPHWGPVFLPDQDRALTVREAARLQSFPDYYRFYGPRVAQYEQVGNAVPVFMARAIAKSLAAHLGIKTQERRHGREHRGTVRVLSDGPVAASQVG
jgi:DNA (cytosine-5)-methyltransferase 1